MQFSYRLQRRSLVALLTGLLCLYIAVTVFTTPRALFYSRAAEKCINRPAVCAHRVVGNEADTWGYNPTQAMPKLFREGIQCFDGDVIRLADGALYLAHPLMFMPALELITQQNLEGQSTEAVLLLAQNLTEADMMRAGQELPLDTVRPVRLWDALQQYASLLGQYNFSPELDKGSKPRSSPWLFLEPKRNTYSEAALTYLWGMIEDLGLQTRVAIWAMDQTHYDILMGATNGHAHVIWAYMDQSTLKVFTGDTNDLISIYDAVCEMQEFSDQVSTVPFPAPWPPEVEATPQLDMFGIAKAASARWKTDAVQPAMMALWVMDELEEFHASCVEGADLVITNQPLKLLNAEL